MKSNYLTHFACGALLLGSALAAAQSTDTTKGNDLTGNPQPPPAKALSSPESVGQDKSSGNNLVGANTGQATAPTAAHPDFNTLDTGKKGYLTKRNVKTHKWLAKNFAKCDLDHDGHLSQDEYASCNK
jgi:hypothetical protein